MLIGSRVFGLCSEEDSKKYEIKICTSKFGKESKAWIGNYGKVYSIDNNLGVPKDNEGVLELSKELTEKLEKQEGEEHNIYIDYKIVRK